MDELLQCLKHTQEGMPFGTGPYELGQSQPLGTSGSHALSAKQALQTSGPHIFLGGNTQSQGMSNTQAVPDIAAAQSSRSVRVALSASVMLVVAVVGVGFFGTRYARNRSSVAPEASQAATPTQPTTASASSPLPQASAVGPVMIRVDSEPAGATVRIGQKDANEVCSATPCDVPADSRSDETVLYVSKRGYVTAQKTVGHGDKSVDVKLVPLPTRPVEPAARKPAAAGYKPDPWAKLPY